MSVLDRIGQKLLFTFDPETAHGMSIAALRCGLPVGARTTRDARLKVTVCGLDFPNPLGMAAGYDKNAEVPDALLGLGFGFAEVGTITPLPQAGNPKPRIFRLTADEAVINRLGFNNEGQAAAEKRLASRKGRAGIVGVNIGANKDSADRVADYVAGVKAMAPVADYLTVNISSPNTPGLRNLQAGGELIELLSAIADARAPAGPPIFLKVAPDLEPGDHERIVRAAIDARIDALIVANTTVSRPPLKSPFGGQAGGLSGAPLKRLASDALRTFRSANGGELPLIAAGGIASADDAWDRILAGASLVQLYSALVYHGPSLARRIADGLAARLAERGMASIAEAVGSG